LLHRRSQPFAAVVVDLFFYRLSFFLPARARRQSSGAERGGVAQDREAVIAQVEQIVRAVA